MLRGRSRRSWLAIAVPLLLVLPTTTPAWAWGRLGHRVISRIAEKNLTPKTRAAITELLGPGETLADASTWADENRRRLPKTAPWHYVDVPLDEPRYDAKWSADDSKHGCVVNKIKEFRATLKDPKRSIEDRRFALRFFIHCIEDLHMPMHVGDNHDRGGNDTQVRFFDRGSNMHRLWDSDMIERAGKTAAALSGGAAAGVRAQRGVRGEVTKKPRSWDLTLCCLSMINQNLMGRGITRGCE